MVSQEKTGQFGALVMMEDSEEVSEEHKVSKRVTESFLPKKNGQSSPPLREVRGWMESRSKEDNEDTDNVRKQSGRDVILFPSIAGKE